jgi:hypothetical protein
MDELLPPLWTTTPWWMPLAAVAVGFFLAQGIEWLRRRRERRAHWAALGAEAAFCERRARTYRKDNVAAPLYRLPMIAYAENLPALLCDAGLTADDVDCASSGFTTRWRR